MATPPGTLLRIYQHLERIGIFRPEVGATSGQVVIRTRRITACYYEEEAVLLSQQAKSWKPGQTEEDILW